jgi:hypothetical protein
VLTLKTAVDTALATLNRTPPPPAGIFSRLFQAPKPPQDARFQGTVVQSLHKGFVGVRDRYIVTFEEASPGVMRASMPDIEFRRGEQLQFEAGDAAALAQRLEGWRDKIEWWAGRLTVHRLQPGRAYRVTRTFQDFHNQTFEAGTVLAFQSQNFVPYHGGYTLFFDRPIYFQDEANADILDDFDLYFADVQSER